jgi:hypothetical protein
VKTIVEPQIFLRLNSIEIFLASKEKIELSWTQIKCNCILFGWRCSGHRPKFFSGSVGPLTFAVGPQKTAMTTSANQVSSMHLLSQNIQTDESRERNK